ncbi:MAG: hypothetical protein RSA15_00905 [Bacilli bacterium]
MKLLKKIFTILLTFIFMITLSLFALILTLKEISIKSINESFVKTEVKTVIISSIKNNLATLNSKDINEIENQILISNELENITKIYLQTFIDNVLSNENQKTPNTKKEFINIVNNTTLSDKQKEKVIEIINQQNEDKIYKKLTQTFKNNLTDKQKNIIKIYNFLSSKILLYCIIAIITVLSLLIIVLADYWLLNFSISFFTVGISFIFLLPRFINKINFKISDKLKLPIKLNIDAINNIMLFYIIISLVLTLTYFIVKYFKKNHKNKF